MEDALNYAYEVVVELENKRNTTSYFPTSVPEE